MAKPSSANQAPVRMHVFQMVGVAWGWLAVVLLAAVAVWAAAPLDQPLTSYHWEPFRAIVCLLWAGLAIGLLCFSVQVTWRAVRLLRCRNEPGYVARLTAALDSPKFDRARRALQTLLDHRGRPFGEVDPCLCDETQVRLMTALYRAWWERFGDATPDSLESAARAAAIVERLTPIYLELVRESGMEPEEKAGRDPELERLPALETGRLAELMRPAFEGTLAALADSINRAGNRDEVRACRTQAHELFAALAEQTLERAWRARFDAAEGRQAGKSTNRSEGHP